MRPTNGQAKGVVVYPVRIRLILALLSKDSDARGVVAAGTRSACELLYRYQLAPPVRYDNFIIGKTMHAPCDELMSISAYFYL